LFGDKDRTSIFFGVSGTTRLERERGNLGDPTQPTLVPEADPPLVGMFAPMDISGDIGWKVVEL